MKPRNRRRRYGVETLPEYGIWQQMKGRCLSKTHKQYPDYGGRGITVCARWRKSFRAFYSDMGCMPQGKCLERKNNDRGYSPTNCCWATRKEQSRNTRRNRLLTYKGETLCLSEWAERYDLKVATLWMRLYKSGMNLDAALTIKPKAVPRHGRPLTANGKTQGLMLWAKEMRVTDNMIRRRLKRGWPEEMAVLIKHTGRGRKFTRG